MVLSEFLSACAAAPDVQLTHFLCVSKDEILEQYAVPPYRMDTLRLCFSMTKSFASLAIGIAVGQGLLSLDTKVSAILPEAMPAHGGNAVEIRVRDLLTMSGGVAENNYETLVQAKDWVRAYFAQDFPHAPGSHYLYCTHGSHVLSAVVERVSGFSLEDFLNRYLFHPMGIFEAQWEHDPNGHTAGGMGLSLYPFSLAKIAQLLLNGGRYGDRQLIPEEYVRTAGSVQIRKQDHDPAEVFGGDGYGFQFHVGKGGHYRMDGAFGQICLLCPTLDRAYIALSSGSKTESLLRLIYTHWIDGNTEKTMAVPAKPESAPARSADIPWGIYTMDENPLSIQTLNLEKTEIGGRLSLQFADRTWSVDFCAGAEVCGATWFIKDLEEHRQQYVCRMTGTSAEWIWTVYYLETPYIAEYRMMRGPTGSQFGFSINCSFTLKNFTANLY